jgi:SAM-dependent methyltransferase
MNPISAELQAFVNEMPLSRASVLDLMLRAASSLPAGASVLDAGAGRQPYRELFSHCQYVASDWAGSLYDAHLEADIVAPLHDLPVDDCRFDAVVCSQVLEHVPNPEASLRELHRVLRIGGTLWLSAPFVWPLHEQPYDFFRYSSHGLRALLTAVGFEDVDVRGDTGYFTTLAVLLTGAPAALDWRWSLREKLLRKAIMAAAAALPRLDRYDRVGALPVGFACRAVRVK